jgi:hypothetical protein
VVQLTDFLERVRERIVSDIMKERRRSNYRLFFSICTTEPVALGHQRQRSARQMIRAECVLEPRVGRSGINEIRQAKLPDVSESLKDFRIDETERQLVDTNVVPDWVAQDFETHARRAD